MLNKKSFRVLISVFVVLLALVFLILVPRNKKSERNFKRYLVELNRDDIDKISFRTPQMNFPTTFEKNSDNRGWTMMVNGNSYDADTGIIKNILKNCVQMRSVRVAGTDKDKWADFKVADTNAIFVEFFVDNKKASGLYVGNFNYLPQQSQNAMRTSQGQGRMTTYVREEGEKKTHSVDGYLLAYFTPDVKYYRQKTLFKAKSSNITRVYAELSDGTKYDIQRTAPGQFIIDGMPIDSSAIIKFLHSADNVNSRDLLDDVSPALLNGPYDMIRIEGENMSPVVIKAYPTKDDRKYIITSSMNPGAYFGDPIERLHRMIFKSRDFYLGKADN